MKLTSVLSNSDVETAIWKKDYTIIVCDNNTHISKNAATINSSRVKPFESN